MNSLIQRLAASALAVSLGAGGLMAVNAPQAVAAVDGSNLVINEVYGGGGNSGAPYNQDFIELYNPTSAPISLDGMTVSYYSAKGGLGGTHTLSGTLEPGQHYLIGAAYGANKDAASFVADTTTGIAMGGSAGQVDLTDASGALIDRVGWGGAVNNETAAAPGTSATTSVTRATAGVDTDNNSVDFVAGAPTPQGQGAAPQPTDPTATPQPTDPTGPTDPTDPAAPITIADIQGTGNASPLASQTVTTEGVVTAVYATGGKNGFFIQMADGTAPAGHTGSTGVFVYNKDLTFVNKVKVGDSVSVTGAVAEFYESTQITATAVDVLPTSLGTVTPTELNQTVWADLGARENYEGMLVKPTGLVVTDNYGVLGKSGQGLDRYGEVGLAFGDKPLHQPTDVGTPGSAEAQAQVADNEARAILLDDGATTDFSKNSGVPLPYLDLDHPVTIGAEATFSEGVVLEYNFNKWRLQPTQPQQGTTDMPVSFSNVRKPAPQLGTDVTVASFNVLNYFTSLGQEESGCKYYADRDGNPTTNNYCKARGAYDQDSFNQQQEKIVSAINQLDASVVALEEVEDSSDFSKNRDYALEQLVKALNAQAGDKWAFVPSPSNVPATGDDVIRTAFIYKKADVTYVDGSTEILNDAAFSNARAPLAATFSAVKNPDTKFVVIANHFKSKGGSGSGDNASPDNDADQSNNTGGWNGDRTRQAEALLKFSQAQQTKQGTDLAFLAGDFNAYAKETPITTITGAGYVDLLEAADGESYLFGGMVGSLDHIFASPAAAALVEAREIWTINAYEPVALEYSRNNYNVTQLHRADQYRASDHNPEIVGFNVTEPAAKNELVVSYFRDRNLDNDLTDGELVSGPGYVYVKDAAGKWWMTSSVDGKFTFPGIAPGTAEVYLPTPANDRTQYFADADDSRLSIVDVQRTEVTYISPSTGKTSSAVMGAGKHPVATVEVAAPEATGKTTTEFVAGFSTVTSVATVSLDGETNGRDDLAELSFVDGAETAVAQFGSGTGDRYAAMTADGTQHYFLDDKIVLQVTAKDGYQIKSVTAVDGSTEMAVEDLGGGKYAVNRADLAEDFGQAHFNVVMEPTPTENPAPTYDPAVKVDRDRVLAGTDVVATATGFKPGELVYFEFRSTPVQLGSAMADETGTATLTFTVPADATLGMHEVFALQGDLEANSDIEVVEPNLVVERPVYTETESKGGIVWLADGFLPGVPVHAVVISPTGEELAFDVTIDENGMASGTLTWATYDQDGNLVEDNLAFPVGEYTIVLTQDGAVAEAKFSVVTEGTSETPAPGATQSGEETAAPVAAGDKAPEGGNGLAATGAEDATLIAAFAAVLCVAGAGVLLRRRHGDA